MMESMKVITVTTHWDCECEINYIHPKNKKVCEVCGIEEDWGPDSRPNEMRLVDGEIRSIH
ncbi:hypothetical protein LCGC14_2542690 [marine sediment metagenome]|uniref:Uncharacterized protein n=1 Tax=marine sediment metagenome TaxID=412755 RepID=A0A0F9D1V4_9ZZZZ